MFRKIKDDFWMLRRSGRNILVFELTYKLAATAVFYPIAIFNDLPNPISMIL